MIIRWKVEPSLLLKATAHFKEANKEAISSFFRRLLLLVGEPHGLVVAKLVKVWQTGKVDHGRRTAEQHLGRRWVAGAVTGAAGVEVFREEQEFEQEFKQEYKLEQEQDLHQVVVSRREECLLDNFSVDESRAVSPAFGGSGGDQDANGDD